LAWAAGAASKPAATAAPAIEAIILRMTISLFNLAGPNLRGLA
jgi:hypothetical protein